MQHRTQETLEALVRESNEQRLCIIGRRGAQQRELYRLLEAGVLVSPWRGFFAEATSWNALAPSERYRRVVRTLAKQHPSWTFCQLTAAVMHGLEVSYTDYLPLHLAVNPTCKTRSNHRITRHPLDEEALVVVDGVRVTNLLRTALDCLIELDFKRGLALADSVLRVGGKSRADLISYIKSRGDVPGWRSALDAASWADSRAANGGESIARATIIEQGYAVPDLQVEVPNVIERGASFFADFMWTLPDGTQVAGELDGFDKYRDPQMTGGRDAVEVLADERRRESRLGAANLQVMRFSFEEVLDVRKFNQILQAFRIPRGACRPRGRAK